jgi:hypothetical protein
MDVVAKPVEAKASAAPWRMAARRSARGSSLLSICIRVSIYQAVNSFREECA